MSQKSLTYYFACSPVRDSPPGAGDRSGTTEQALHGGAEEEEPGDEGDHAR